MIIKFSKNIKLSEWVEHPSGWCKYNIKLLNDGSEYHERAIVQIYFKDKKVRHIRFYEPIFKLDKMYNPDNIVLDWNPDFAKNCVDNFLIKMSRLTAFL
jgi:hypothetical protein